MKPENEFLIRRALYYIIFGENVILGVLYLFGSLATLLPQKSEIIPDATGSVALGILLALTGCFGKPFFPNECPKEEDGDTL